jgi:hypothetical protein
VTLLAGTTGLAGTGGLAAKKVLVDPHPAWGGLAVAIAATVLFLGFSAWIVVQRVRHGRESRDD